MADATQSATVANYASAVANYRSVTKWVIGSLAAVAAVLTAGLSLSSLSQIDNEWRLIAAVVALICALAVVCAEIGYTAQVLLPSTVTIERIVAVEDGTEAMPDSMKALFEHKAALLSETGAASFKELYDWYTAARKQRIEALRANQQDPKNPQKQQTAEAAMASARTYTDIVAGIVAQAAYDEVKGRLSVAKQIGGGLLGALAIGLFAVLLAWPSDPPPARSADFHGARLVGADLSGTSLIGARFSKMTLRRVDFHGADLRGADFRKAHLIAVNLRGAVTNGAHWHHAVWSAATCPDGTLSSNVGGSCRGHFQPTPDK